LVYLKLVLPLLPSSLYFFLNKNCVAADAEIGSENCVAADHEIDSEKNGFAADAENGSENCVINSIYIYFFLLGVYILPPLNMNFILEI